MVSIAPIRPPATAVRNRKPASAAVGVVDKGAVGDGLRAGVAEDDLPEKISEPSVLMDLKLLMQF
jgi:hypothetical protein